jgi:hypothetical protein
MTFEAQTCFTGDRHCGGERVPWTVSHIDDGERAAHPRRLSSG